MLNAKTLLVILFGNHPRVLMREWCWWWWEVSGFRSSHSARRFFPCFKQVLMYMHVLLGPELSAEWYQDRARLLLARYSQRWVKAVSRGALAITGAEGTSTPNSSHVAPRHALSRQCPCQYIEDHLHYKPQGECLICEQMGKMMEYYSSV